MALSIDPTINAGHLATIAAIIFAGFGVYISGIQEQNQQNLRISLMEKISEERNDADNKWRVEAAQSMKEITTALRKLNDSMIRLESNYPEKRWQRQIETAPP